MTSITQTIPTNMVNPTACQKHEQASQSNLYGRGVSFVCGAATTAASAVSRATSFIFTVGAKLTESPADMAAVCRKLHKYVFVAIDRLGNSSRLLPFAGVLSAYVNIVDLGQIATDVDGIANKKFKKDSNIQFAARIAVIVANAGGALLWFQEIGFINLSKAAAKIGNFKAFSFVPKVVSSVPVLRDLKGLQSIANGIGELRVFGLISKIPLSFVVFRALDLAYTFLAIDAAQRLARETQKEKKISAGLDLASYVAELTLSVVLIAGVTNVIALGVMGGACLTLALTAFAYNVTHKAEKEPANPNKLVPNVVG